MNIQGVFYHGIRDQVRRVLAGMTPEEIDRGIDAFDTGAKNWSHCFFARALPALQLDRGAPERKLMEHFKLQTAIPIRIVYCTFDGVGVSMSREELKQFISDVRFSEIDKVLGQLRRVDYSEIETRSVETCA